MEAQTELKSGGQGGLERVLVASDLTAYADRALDRAALLARSGGAIRLVHAFDPRLLPDEYVELNTREARESLQHEVQESGLAERFDVSVDVLSGKADEIILKQAQAIPADLIVLAMSRDASLARVIRGTTIDRVVRRAQCPVLVVRSRPRGPYARILVAVDLAAPSRRALDLVLQRLPDAEINIVHVDEAVRADAPSPVVRDERRHQIEDMVAARCISARRPGPGSVGGPSLILRCGKVLDVLQKEIGAVNPDVIVAGTQCAVVYPISFSAVSPKRCLRPRVRTCWSLRRESEPETVAERDVVGADPMLSRKFLTVKDVADLLQVGEVTVRHWIRNGELRAIDVGRKWRIAPRDLEQFVDRRASPQQLESTPQGERRPHPQAHSK